MKTMPSIPALAQHSSKFNMAFSITSRCSSVVSGKASRPNVQPSAGRVSRCVVVQAVKAPEASRRELLAGVALSCATLLNAAPAQAIFGFGDEGDLQATYAKTTTDILTEVRSTLDLPKDDPAKEDKVKELRKDINKWVAEYRREPRVSGRPSYGQTYSVLNALAGHYNSFGATAPIPKKRLDRINKELDDATTFLSRGR